MNSVYAGRWSNVDLGREAITEEPIATEEVQT
jgi:hypothetical protein